MNRTQLERAFKGEGYCACPEPLDYARAAFAGVELEPASCPLHTAEGQRTAAEAAEASARLDVLRSIHRKNLEEVRALRDQRPPEHEPLDPFLDSLERMVGLAPSTRRPPAAPGPDLGASDDVLARHLGAAVADPHRPIDTD